MRLWKLRSPGSSVGKMEAQEAWRCRLQSESVGFEQEGLTFLVS